MGRMIEVPLAPLPPVSGELDGHRSVTRSAKAEFTDFAREHTAALYRVAYLLSGDEHRAHDLTQIALERTFRSWSRIDRNPFAFARRVIATSRIDSWRRTRREVLHDSASGFELRPVPDAGHEVAERDRLVRALRTLPETQRRVVVLRYLLDRSEQQTADELDLPLGTVKSAGARGLAALRNLLGIDDGEVQR